MTIINLNLNLDKDYTKIINNIIKIITILIVFQYMIIWSHPNINIVNSIANNFMNDIYLSMIIYVILGLLTYYLVIKQIIYIF